ncbi:MAG: hypothetical protein NVS4B12_26580 [Ktedonobacteraceae bacterium]
MTRERTRDISDRKGRFPIRRLSLRLDSPKRIVKTLWKHDPLLRLPINGQLMLGFLLAALLAAFITGIIGVQRANALSRQAEFYQSLFRANTTLSMGTDLLKAINSQMDKNLLDAESVPTKVFLSPLVQGVYQQFEPHEKQGHTVSIEIADALSVWADAQHLRQVLRNLLTNAFKYTPQHTSIYISAASASETEETAFSSSPIYLRIKDTGPGIPLEEQNLLFKKFVRLSRDISGNVRGIGLGLYICKQLVDEMGGHIWVESSGIAGEGCCFYVALPDASSTSPLEDHANRATRTRRQEIRHA